jgi:hypothetical protein
MTDLAAMGEWNPEAQVRHNDMWKVISDFWGR